MLETPRLVLRPMRAADVDDLLHIFADPKVMASFGVSPFTRAQMESWVQRNLDHQAQYGYGLFSVILKPTGLLIGDCGLEHLDVEGVRIAELGYDFGSDHWHQGFATEAATAVRDYAFQTLRLSELTSLIRVGNAASRNVAEKIGMHLARAILRHEQRYWQYVIARPAGTAEL